MRLSNYTIKSDNHLQNLGKIHSPRPASEFVALSRQKSGLPEVAGQTTNNDQTDTCFMGSVYKSGGNTGEL